MKRFTLILYILLLALLSQYSFAKEEDTCPPKKPFLCNGKCVKDQSKCPFACDLTSPYRCGNGTCVSNVSECVNTQTCSSPKFVCWNGVCADSPSLCDPLPACTKQRPKRCWNSCIKRNEVCSSSPPPCPTKSCPDGSCIDNNAECPSYNGCPLDTPFQCSDGKCAKNETECLCEDGKYRCFNGQCASSEADCVTPPFSRKPFDISFEIDPTQEHSIEALGDDIEDNSPKVLCTLTVPASAFESATNTVVVQVRQVADSKLRQVTGDDLSDIVSSVVDFTLDPPMSTPFLKNVKISCSVVLPQNVEPSNACLAFINETSGKWECVNSEISAENGEVAGWTNHFTAYGVLFTGGSAKTDSQSASKSVKEQIPLGAIIGAVVGVIGLSVIGGVLFLVLDKRRKRKNRRRSGGMASSPSNVSQPV